MSRSLDASGGGLHRYLYRAGHAHATRWQHPRLLKAEDLEVRFVESLREHYAATMDAWRMRLEAQCSEVKTVVAETTGRVWRPTWPPPRSPFSNDGRPSTYCLRCAPLTTADQPCLPIPSAGTRWRADRAEASLGAPRRQPRDHCAVARPPGSPHKIGSSHEISSFCEPLSTISARDPNDHTLIPTAVGCTALRTRPSGSARGPSQAGASSASARLTTSGRRLSAAAAAGRTPLHGGGAAAEHRSVLARPCRPGHPRPSLLRGAGPARRAAVRREPLPGTAALGALAHPWFPAELTG